MTIRDYLPTPPRLRGDMGKGASGKGTPRGAELLREGGMAAHAYYKNPIAD